MSKEKRTQDLKRVLDMPVGPEKLQALTQLQAQYPKMMQCIMAKKESGEIDRLLGGDQKIDDRCFALGDKAACDKVFNAMVQACPRHLSASGIAKSAQSSDDGIPMWVWYSLGGAALFFAYRHFSK